MVIFMFAGVKIIYGRKYAKEEIISNIIYLIVAGVMGLGYSLKAVNLFL